MTEFDPDENEITPEMSIEEQLAAFIIGDPSDLFSDDAADDLTATLNAEAPQITFVNRYWCAVVACTQPAEIVSFAFTLRSDEYDINLSIDGLNVTLCDDHKRIGHGTTWDLGLEPNPEDGS